MSYLGTTINDSPIYTGVSAAAFTDKAFHAVKFDSNGEIALCSTEGEAVLGLLPAEAGTKAAGDDIAVQIKDIGLMVASGEIAAGAEVMTDANGKAKPATAGKFIIGYALKAATAAGDVIPVQIAKGVMPGGVKRFTTTFTNNQGIWEADNSVSDIISAWQAGKFCDCVVVMAQDTYGLGILADVVITENTVVFNSILATDAGPRVALFQGYIDGATDVWLDPIIRDVVPAYTVDDIGKFLGVVSDGDGGAKSAWATPQ